MTFDPGSRSRLTKRDLPRFAGDTLFDRIGRVVAAAECLPRKELYEAWEVARRVRRRFRGGRVVDLACGHGLLAALLVILDDRSKVAIAVDARVPESAAKLAAALVAEWPRLADRVEIRQAALESVALDKDDLVVCVHGCGVLSDLVLTRAIAVGARVGVLPCCHEAGACDAGGLDGWMDVSLAIDATRVARLRGAGYAVATQLIPAVITPKNRLILASK